MSRSLPDAREGDKYRVTTNYGPVFDARIVSLDDRLVVVVDYNAIGPTDDIPVPWAHFEWEKVQ